MLVLTRRAGESIIIDDEIELKVLKIRGSQVHIGIEAPKRAAVAPVARTYRPINDIASTVTAKICTNCLTEIPLRFTQ